MQQERAGTSAGAQDPDQRLRPQKLRTNASLRALASSSPDTVLRACCGVSQRKIAPALKLSSAHLSERYHLPLSAPIRLQASPQQAEHRSRPASPLEAISRVGTSPRADLSANVEPVLSPTSSVSRPLVRASCTLREHQLLTDRPYCYACVRGLIANYLLLKGTAGKRAERPGPTPPLWQGLGGGTRAPG